MGKITFNVSRQASPGNDKSYIKCDLSWLVESSVTDFMMWLNVGSSPFEWIALWLSWKGEEQVRKTKQQLTRQDRDGKMDKQDF